MPRFRVRYFVRDACEIVVEAETETIAREIVLNNEFEEDDTYEFIDAEIISVDSVERE